MASATALLPLPMPPTMPMVGIMLTPMVQDDELIRNRCVCRQQVTQRPDDSLTVQVAPGIVIFAHGENTGMVASQIDDQFVEVQKIIVISRDNGPTVQCGTAEM